VDELHHGYGGALVFAEGGEEGSIRWRYLPRDFTFAVVVRFSDQEAFPDPNGRAKFLTSGHSVLLNTP